MPTFDESSRARLDFLEMEASRYPRRHAARLLGLAVFGYLYPILLLLLSFALVIGVLSVGPAAWGASDLRAFIFYIATLLVSLTIAAVIFRTFWVSLPPPTGQTLRTGEAAPLRQLIEDVRIAGKGPKLHVIFIDWSLNASVTQRRRFGFWSPRRSYLVIGMPLLIALNPTQIRVVLAHEFGHLRKLHSGFNAWIYRVNNTWESLASPFKSATRLRHWVIGWFIQRYGNYFSQSALAIRRLHEYEADKHASEVASPTAAADALVAIAFTAYRMEKRFWPALWREAGREPLPPSDVLTRIETFLASDPPQAFVSTWIERERRSRTPVTSAHPCLVDRLAAIGCPASRLDELACHVVAQSHQPSESAVSLLGEARSRLWTVTAAAWKALAIQRWRMEHAYARHLTEKAVAGHDPAWESLRVCADYASPDEAQALLCKFLAESPGHAGASFAIGRLLLQLDDDEALLHLETALTNDSQYIGPSLHLMLDHHRDAGRDADADPIIARLAEHERISALSRSERLKISRRDRFLPHGMSDSDLAKVCRIVNRYPRIRRAYLARKQVRLFSDKPSYVLAVERHGPMATDNRRRDKALADGIAAELDIPCAVVILRWTSPHLRSRLLAACPVPVFSARD